MGVFAKCLSQRHNLTTSTGKLADLFCMETVNTNVKVTGMTQLSIKFESSQLVQKQKLSVLCSITRPSELLGRKPSFAIPKYLAIFEETWVEAIADSNEGVELELLEHSDVSSTLDVFFFRFPILMFLFLSLTKYHKFQRQLD